MRFSIRALPTVIWTRLVVVRSVIAIVLLLPNLLAAPASGTQTQFPGDHPVEAMEAFIARHGTNDCDSYGVNDLTWDQFRQPTPAEFARSAACPRRLGPSDTPPGPTAIEAVWTVACFRPTLADGSGGFPRASRFMAWIPCTVTVHNDAAYPIDLTLDDFFLVNDRADTSWGPTTAASRLFPTDLQFADGALAPGECRAGLLLFLLPDDTAPPVMLEWRSPRYGTLAGIFPTIVITRFFDGDPTMLAQELAIPQQNPDCR